MSETQLTKRHYPVGLDHPQFKHGGRSKYKDIVRAQLREKLDVLDSYDPLDLEDEAQLLRALLMEVLEREKSKPSTSDADLQRVMVLIEQFTRTAERINRMRNDTAITAAEVKLIAARLADVVSRYIPDEDQQQKFMREVFSIGIGGA